MQIPLSNDYGKWVMREVQVILGYLLLVGPVELGWVGSDEIALYLFSVFFFFFVFLKTNMCKK